MVGEPKELRRTTQKGPDCREETPSHDEDNFVNLSVGYKQKQEREDNRNSRELKEQDSNVVLLESELMDELVGQDWVDCEEETVSYCVGV